MRMFFKNVDKPIILRFATLDLVRSEWRKYGFDLLQPGIYIPNDDAATQFDVSAVSIEVDGSRLPVNYVLPPNIIRDISPTQANLIALNEQSMSLTVCNLKDGESRAAYKNTSLDVRSYKNLLMFIHAEAAPNAILHNNDLHAFIRLGTDYADNYYEYDIPLQVTPPGNYNGTNIDDQYRVWPEANEMTLVFATLEAAKQKRNGTGASVTSEYATMDGNRKITVKGNPNLSAIKTMMIGIRNPKKITANDGDDGLEKCGQMWVDELRLSGFNESGGGAATGHVTAKLADFGTASLSGNWYSPGWGSIEDKVSALKRETLLQYDFTSSFELGKFLPQNAKIHIPMFIGYSETFITPQYDPLNPDLLLAQELKDPILSKAYKDSLKNETVDYTQRKSINFINVKKEKGKNVKKNHFYDIENLSASFSHTELYHRNINLMYDSTRNTKGNLMYSFSPSPKNIQPFSKTKILQSKYLQLIKDINFSLVPNKLGFSTDVQRSYETQAVRNTTAGDMLIVPTFNKTFTMIRNYDLKWDITKALKLDFIATNDSRILEPIGAINTQAKKDTVVNNLIQGGKTTSYNQQLNVNYAIPINKLPLLDFTTASVRYTGTYNWLRAPFGADSLGNTIQNSAALQWTGQVNMVTLYNKIPYFKRINQNANKKTDSKSIKKLPPLKDKDGKAIKDSTKKENKNPSIVLEYVARVIMSLKNVNVTYSTNQGTILPGYSQFTNMMGMDKNFQGPTPGFVFGDQTDIRPIAVRNGWMDSTQSLNTPFVHTLSKNLNIRANVEPIPDLKIELTALRTQSTSRSEFFKWRTNDTLPDHTIVNHFASESPIETGNFSMSFLSFSTSFKNGNDVFQNFLADRTIISGRLGAQNDSSRTKLPVNHYAVGYNATSQDVLIPAFVAAYSGKAATKVGIGALSAFPAMPAPNWRITYDGLSKMDAVKKYFKSITISHAYRSTYNVSSYASNLLFNPIANEEEFTGTKEAISSIPTNPNFIPKNLINTITISEQWSPLIKIDAVLNNSILANFEYKKDRNLSLGLTSLTITEVAGSEIVIGSGYRLKNISLGKKLLIKGKPIKSDLNLKCDLSFRQNQTVIRRIDEEVSQITAGTNIISIKVSADYIINERINVKLFYDRIINTPVISNSFPTTNTNAGLSLRLSLSN